MGGQLRELKGCAGKLIFVPLQMTKLNFNVLN